MRNPETDEALAMIRVPNQFSKLNWSSLFNLGLRLIPFLLAGQLLEGVEWIPEPSVVEPVMIEGLFNVAEYGAAGDGVTDDTESIRMAIAEAGAWADANAPQVATVYFPTGEYAVAPQESDASWSSYKPAIFTIPTSNVHFVGDGMEQSVIMCYTLGLKDPSTNWTVIGDGFGYFKIKRGACFSTPRTPANNVHFSGLRISGQCDATGNAAVGGSYCRLGSQDSVLYHYNGNSKGDTLAEHGYTNGTLLRFGTNENQPPEIVPQAAYYVVNASADSFQLAETPGGEALVLSNTIDDATHRFISTDGDGWNMGHSAFDLGTQAFQGFTVENCHLDRWRGEIMHAGGDDPRTITIRNSIIEHCNASMISVPSLVLEDSIIRYGYNGIENYARKPWHKAEIRRCHFVAEANGPLAGSNAIAYLGSPETGAVIENNTFDHWYRGVLLSEVANNVSIVSNDFTDTGTPIHIVRLGLYPNDPWVGFENITVSQNDFRTTNGGENAVFTQFGNVPNKNFVIKDNALHPGTVSGTWKYLIQDFSGSSPENREGYTIAGNTLECGADFGDSVRPVWKGNVRGKLWVWGQKVDLYSWDGETAVEVAFNDDHLYLRNHTSFPFVRATLKPSLYGKFPSGYQVELESSEINGWELPANSAWNNFTSDLQITKGKPVWIVVEENGKFSLLDDSSAEPKPEEPPEPQKEPLFPRAPEASVDLSGDGEVWLNWSSLGSVDSIDAEVSVGGNAFVDFGRWNYEGALQASIPLGNLEKGIEYIFRIRVIRHRVPGTWSETESFSIPKTLPDHHWTFDEGEGLIAADAGSGVLELYLDQVNWGNGIGGSNSGIEFSGKHLGVCIPDADSINLQDRTSVTISLWIWLFEGFDDFTSVVFEHGDYWRGLSLILENQWLLAKGWNRPENESGWEGTRLLGGRLSPNEWNHVALVLDGEETLRNNALLLYVNGELVSSGPGSQLWAVMDKSGLGQIQGTSSYRGREIRAMDPFQGAIDDLQIWNRALTCNEITELILSSSL